MTRQGAAQAALNRWGRNRKDIDRILYIGCTSLGLLAGVAGLLTPSELRSVLPLYTAVCGAYTGAGAVLLGVLSAIAFLARSDRSGKARGSEPGDDGDGQK